MWRSQAGSGLESPSMITHIADAARGEFLSTVLLGHGSGVQSYQVAEQEVPMGATVPGLLWRQPNAFWLN